MIKKIIQKLKGIISRPPKKERISGIIKFFDRKKRFGFIISNHHEYFFHAAATKPKDFKALQDGVSVIFNVVQGKKGLQADNIEIETEVK